MGHRVWSCPEGGVTSTSFHSYIHIGIRNTEKPEYPRYAFALLAAKENRWKKRGYQIRLGCITFTYQPHIYRKRNLFHNIDLILFLLGQATQKGCREEFS